MVMFQLELLNFDKKISIFYTIDLDYGLIYFL